ncbi:MAG: hypothetical protein QOE31_451 [Solirubrobacteraceae bacterium]|nr:hypothetical protein [Solirubrobacteraceae bacterium]
MTAPTADRRHPATVYPPDPQVRIREIRAGDEAVIAALFGDLDPESCRRRWFGAVDVRRAADWAAHPERVAAVGLLAFAGDALVGHAVLVPLSSGRGEVAFEVAAPWRHHGIAGALLERLIAAAGAHDLREVYADVLPENTDMLVVLREHGRHAESREGGVVSVTIPVAERRHPAQDRA